MSRFRLHSILAALALMASLAGCNTFFGKKNGLDYITPPQPATDQVSYVPVFPYITGLQYPTAILAGNDQLLYVVDSAAQQLISYDQAGREQGRMTVPGIRAIAQDRTLDILALGRERPAGTGEAAPSQPVIFRIAIKNGTYGLGPDKIVNRVYFPNYLGPTVSQPDLASINFNGIAVLPDNSYLVTRSGPGAELLSRNPIDAVLLFDRHDRFQTPIPIQGDGGASFSDFFKTPYAIATLPPRSLTFPATDPQDFLVSTIDPDQDTFLRVRYVSVTTGEAGKNYTIKTLPADGGGQAPGALYQPSRFGAPRGLAVAGDETGYLFVTDQDSVYQFSPEGYEGVRLRSSQTNTGYNKVSFGGRGNGPYQFVKPRGLAYANRILYVADAGNGRICRYKLSTDFQ